MQFLKKSLYLYLYEKNFYIFFFLFLPNISNSNPLGVSYDNLENNFKCLDLKNSDKEINFGFKEYDNQKEVPKFLLSIPFNKKSKKYSSPASAVYEVGTYTINNITYDNLQIWFEHGNVGNDIFIFRRSLVKQNNTYVLNDSLFKSTSSIQKKLDKIKKKIINESDKDYDKAAKLIKKYGGIAFGYVLKNDYKTFFKNYKLKCSLKWFS